MPREKFTMSFDVDTYKSIKKLAIDEGVTASKLVEDLMLKRLKEEEKKKSEQKFSKNG